MPNIRPSLQAKELPTFKDNDFLNEGQKLQIGDDNKKYFLEKLKRDVEVRNTSWFSSGLLEKLMGPCSVEDILDLFEDEPHDSSTFVKTKPVTAFPVRTPK